MIFRGVIEGIISLIGTGLDKAIEDKDERARIRAELTKELYSHQQAIVESMTKVALAEIKGESWLQRSWRPILMLWFAILIGAYWIGFTPENLPDSAINSMFDVVLASVSIYTAGRTGEKVAQTWAATKRPPPPTSTSGPGGLF